MYDSDFHPDAGLPPRPDAGRSDVFGRDVCLNSEARGLVGLCSFVGLGVKVSSPMAGRGRGLDLPDGFTGLTPVLAAFLRRSSVARRRASRASSSEVWSETARFLGKAVRIWSTKQTGTHFSDTAASRSAILLSILNRSFKAREKERAMVDCGLALPEGFHSRSSSSSDMLKWLRYVEWSYMMEKIGS